MTNALLSLDANIIGVQANSLNMRAYVDIGQFWTDGLSINAAYEGLLIKGRKIDRRTLTSAKEGTLTRSEYSTLVRLRDYARELSGNENLRIEDILVIKENEED